MTSGPEPPPVPPATPEVPPAVRAQLLATEHWSLLATRGVAWSEVMARITLHLTVTSASLVVLALVTQAVGFGTAFDVLAIGLASANLLLGLMTVVRVHNASVDDGMLLLGMNRLRAAYLEIDPTLEKYLVTGWHDDQAGLMRTYLMGVPRPLLRHIIGSTSMFMTVVNALVAGALGALIASAPGGGPAVTAVVGGLTGLICLGLQIRLADRSFRALALDVRFPTPNP